MKELRSQSKFVRDGEEYHDRCPKCGHSVFYYDPTRVGDHRCPGCKGELNVEFFWANGGVDCNILVKFNG